MPSLPSPTREESSMAEDISDETDSELESSGSDSESEIAGSDSESGIAGPNSSFEMSGANSASDDDADDELMGTSKWLVSRTPARLDVSWADTDMIQVSAGDTTASTTGPSFDDSSTYCS